jgi:hypothetical protein
MPAPVPILALLYYAARKVSKASAEMEGVAPSAEPPELRGVSTEQAIMLAVDALFLFVGVVYGSRVLAPKPMTYLSEIAFPMDVRALLAQLRLHSLLCGKRSDGCGCVAAVLRQIGGVVHVVPVERVAVAVRRDFLLLAAVPSTVRSWPAERCCDDGDARLGERCLAVE